MNQKKTHWGTRHVKKLVWNCDSVGRYHSARFADPTLVRDSITKLTVDQLEFFCSILAKPMNSDNPVRGFELKIRGSAPGGTRYSWFYVGDDTVENTLARAKAAAQKWVDRRFRIARDRVCQ